IKGQIKGWDMTGKALRSNHYKGMIDGLLLGRGGTIQGNTYKSKVGECAVSAPLEWEIKEPDQGPLCLLQLKEFSVQLSYLKTKEPLTTENFAKAIEEQNSQLKKTEEGEIKAANISGRIATYLSQEENKGYRIGYFVKDDLAYLLVGLAPLDKIGAAQSDIDRIIKSFAVLSREELALLPSNRLKVYTVQEGDDFKKIAREFSLEPLEIARFNGLAEDAQLKAGDKLKILP
ncbi:LysM peptidoglycan-binding domain-containing protein, partial [bacterium]|nr:LysM peptidoglycan-binding domain-containing protein [bacterium]